MVFPKSFPSVTLSAPLVQDNLLARLLCLFESSSMSSAFRSTLPTVYSCRFFSLFHYPLLMNLKDLALTIVASTCVFSDLFRPSSLSSIGSSLMYSFFIGCRWILVATGKVSERFLGTWQGRGDRSVFVTSHRPVHCSRALCCHSGSSYCVTSVSFRTGVWYVPRARSSSIRRCLLPQSTRRQRLLWSTLR